MKAMRILAAIALVFAFVLAGCGAKEEPAATTAETVPTLAAGQSLELTALGEELPPQAVDRMTGWLLPGAAAVTAEEAEDCLRCLNDYAARMSREQLGQLSGEELRRYIEALNRQKNKQGD